MSRNKIPLSMHLFTISFTYSSIQFLNALMNLFIPKHHYWKSFMCQALFKAMGIQL